MFAELDPAARVPWFGPAMSVASSLTARIMETWAHGQDIADTVGQQREPTDRLRHVAHIGVGARPFSYAANRRPVPAEPVRVELIAPSGATWAWGPPGASDRVTAAAGFLPAGDPAPAPIRHSGAGSRRRGGRVARASRSRSPDHPAPGASPASSRASMADRPVLIANCSGYYGDRIAAAGRCWPGRSTC